MSQMTVGQVRCTVKLVSYTGDLGYTIFCIPMDQGTLWKISGKMAHFWASPLWHARDDVAAPRSFFGSWSYKFLPDYKSVENGLNRFIKWDKDLIGKASAHIEIPARQLVTFDVDAFDADDIAYEPIFINCEVLGFCKSGGF